MVVNRSEVEKLFDHTTRGSNFREPANGSLISHRLTPCCYQERITRVKERQPVEMLHSRILVSRCKSNQRNVSRDSGVSGDCWVADSVVRTSIADSQRPVLRFCLECSGNAYVSSVLSMTCHLLGGQTETRLRLNGARRFPVARENHGFFTEITRWSK